MKDKLTRGVVWLTGAKLLVNVLGLCSTLILARLLTPADFGLVAIATTMLTILASVTELSMASALIQHRNPTEAHFDTAWTLNLLRALVLSGAFCASSPWVADYFKDERLVTVMLVLGASIFVAGVSNPKVVVLTRQLQFWQEFAVAVTQKLLGFVVGVTLAIVYKSYWALLGGTVASQVAGVVVSYCIQPYLPRFTLKHTKELWSFSIWLTLGQVVSTLNWKFDHLLIGAKLGPRAMGLYTVGDNLAGLPTRETAGPLEQTLFPGFCTVASDPERLKGVYLRAQSLVFFAVFPVGVFFAVMGNTLVDLVLGPKWVDAVFIVQALAIIFGFSTIASAVQPLGMALGRTRALFVRDVVIFAIRIPIIFSAATLAGLAGIVYARVLTGFLGAVINMNTVRYLIGLRVSVQVGNVGRTLTGAVAMGGAVWALRHLLPEAADNVDRLLMLGACGSLGLFTYLLVHFSLWALARRPTGPESEVVRLCAKGLTKLRGSIARRR